MHLNALLLAASCTALAKNAAAKPSSYAVWAADSAIARKQGNGLDSSGKVTVSYEHGELQWGLRQLYEKTGNKTYYDYIVTGASNVVSDSGAINSAYKLSDYSLDPVRTGPTFLYLYQQTKASKWKTAAGTYRKQLETHPRTAEGQFWHKQRYYNQGWLDGIYMGDIFYAQYTKDFQATNTTAWDDIALQYTLIYKNTLQNTGSANYTGLLYHGYDYSKTASWASSDRGHSPEIWDRALGWYMMALVDVLEIFPTSHPGYASILKILQDLAPKLVKAAEPTSGVWWLVMSQPGRAKNYFESSGSAMFVYSLLKGVRLGYVKDSDGSIVAAAKKAYGYMTKTWITAKSDGTFDWSNTVEVGSLSGDGSYDYYVGVATVTNDLKGLAAFLLASLEYEKL